MRDIDVLRPQTSIQVHIFALTSAVSGNDSQ
jgi:hypothetical protein